MLRKVPAEPLAGESELRLLESVAGLAPFEGEVGTGLFEQDGRAVESRRVRGLERDHGAEEDGAGENIRPEKEHRGGNVGAVGVADRDDFSEMTSGPLVFDEIGQFMRAADEVVLVENTRSQTTEEARLAVLEDLSARAEQRGAGAEEPSERGEVVLVAAGAVEEEKSRGGAGMKQEIHTVQFSVFGEFSGEAKSPGTPARREDAAAAAGLKTVD